LILDLEFHQHLGSHKHVINIIMWFRDMGCYNPLSTTHWESHVDSVKAIGLQMEEIREALLEVSDTDKDETISSQAYSLATNEFGDFEFMLSIIIWYGVLSAIILASKHLQSKDMLIDIAIEKVQGLISFFTTYRETGFPKA
jgi:hypothetical protein